MFPVSRDVKSQRAYDGSQRRAAALARREAVLAAAHALFLDRGFARTTVTRIAEDAGVSPETVYKSFGGKRGLIEALYRRAVRGAGAEPAYERSNRLRTEADPHVVLRGWARLAMEVGPRVAAIQLLVRDAAIVDPALRRLHAEMDDERLARMTENAAYLASAGHLRAEVSVGRAADLMWTITAPETVDLLVHRRGWSHEQYADHVYQTLTACLL